MIWGLNAFGETLQIFAYWKEGWIMEYLWKAESLVDWIRLSADAMVLAYVFYKQLECLESKLFLCVFALCAFWKWIAILYTLTPFRTFGLSILPILHTMLDVGPFLTVLAFHIFGLMHGYISLNVPDIDIYESGLLVYQLGLLGDASPDDLDGGNKKYWAVVRIFYCSVAFLVTITLMNTFIAALGNSFTIASSKMEILYQAHLADRVLTHMAVRQSLQKLVARLFPAWRAHKSGDKSLWYCTSEKLEEAGFGRDGWLGF
jgi:hypothetical protein